MNRGEINFLTGARLFWNENQACLQFRGEFFHHERAFQAEGSVVDDSNWLLLSSAIDESRIFSRVGVEKAIQKGFATRVITVSPFILYANPSPSS